MKSLINIRFGRLLVKSFVPAKRPSWSCLCDCGNTCIVARKELNNGDTKSCGCLRRECARRDTKNHFKKGVSLKSRLSPEAYERFCRSKRNRVLTPETKKKMSLAKIGKRPYVMTEKTRRKMAQSHIGIPVWNKGKKNCFSDESLKKMSIASTGRFKGSKSHFWRGGITPINFKIRHSVEYKLWRESVFKRDNYTCISCGQVGGKLNADHVKPFSLFPDLRFDINNGRTLCVPCHRKTDTYGIKLFNKLNKKV